MLLNCGVGEDSWDSLNSKEIQPVHPKGDQSWIFIGRTDVEAEAPILWPLMQRSDSFEKTLMLGKIEGGRRRGWQRMRWLDGITNSVDMNLSKFPGVGNGQGSLACCSPWSFGFGHDPVTQLNWTCQWNINYILMWGKLLFSWHRSPAFSHPILLWC